MIEHNDFIDKLTEFAMQSILYEVACFPSLGLVSPISSGAHDDMDFFTFLDSTVVLGRYLRKFAEEGAKELTPKEIFCKLRPIGVECEKEMFKKTKGINTHKGMIFVIGLIQSAAAYVLTNKMNFECIKNVIVEMTEGISNEELDRQQGLDSESKLTHGQKVYKKYGLKGIRGEAEEGFPIVFNGALSHFERISHIPMNDRLVDTLIYIMKYADDTTILHRHDMETLEYVKSEALKIMELGGIESEEGKKEIEKLTKSFESNRISPGGSADLLAATVLVWLIKNEFFKENK
ncbi:triphosphoribosyl-dephospho-CoA synthase CitG [Oceanirhabdus sp. W0125-5]|uniref:triphosphoribosyl-dephospho-CoA synthase CitG n=1 Tax=Oceanirhabdus sp. W0125-5 TaxID=2999116 RepID=UPI0022F2CA17|nr:triphosphoribosyl-dephospho-CoA synthase CitG [Oceanirhabdus sp. W0125-5]WBW98044.1 triphosphoribosyl-dephospho-CoA synthase CitG [Oceanirhabdus sp. W0125-5]